MNLMVLRPEKTLACRKQLKQALYCKGHIAKDQLETILEPVGGIWWGEIDLFLRLLSHVTKEIIVTKEHITLTPQCWLEMAVAERKQMEGEQSTREPS